MDDEIRGEGNSANFKYRMADVRLGRFFATDPLEAAYPHNSPYAFSENRVIDGIELEGLEWHKPEILTTQYWEKWWEGTGTKSAFDHVKKHPEDAGHFALDIMGVIPVVGEVFDGVNAIWYTAEGDYLNAGISAAALIPIFGESGKISKYVVKYGGKFYDAGKQVIKNTDKIKTLPKLTEEVVKKQINLSNKSLQKLGVNTKGIAEGTTKLSWELASVAAKKYTDIFQCKSCADAVTKALREAGISGELVTLKSNVSGMWNIKANKNITENGMHYGVLVDGKVFDNINPNGIDFDSWIKQFEAGGGAAPEVIKTEF